MTRYGITEDYYYDETHRRHRLVIWSGAFFLDYEGYALSLPNRDGYMVALPYADRIRVECPCPRDDSNYREVDQAINDAINNYYEEGGYETL